MLRKNLESSHDFGFVSVDVEEVVSVRVRVSSIVVTSEGTPELLLSDRFIA